MTQPGKKAILVLRPDNIGDVILFTGCLKHIRRLYPEAEITLAVKQHIVSLIQLCPYTDKTLSYQKILPWWLRLYWRFPHLYRSLKMIEKIDRVLGRFELTGKVKNRLFKKKSLNWDVLICPVRSPNEQLLWFVKSIFAKKKIGMVGCQSNLEKNILFPSEIFNDFMELEEKHFRQHELETNRRFIQYLTKKDLAVQEVWPEFWLSKEDKDFPSKFNNDRKGYTVGLAVGASVFFKEWPIEKYGELLNCLLSVKRVVLFGGTLETGKANLVQKGIKCQRREIEFINLAGKTTLRQLTASVNICDLLISVDTALLHIATALKIPTVGIVGGGHFGRFYPWGDPRINRVVNIAMDCYRCDWFCVYGDYRCVRDISVSAVVAECEAIFEELRKRPKANERL